MARKVDATANKRARKSVSSRAKDAGTVKKTLDRSAAKGFKVLNGRLLSADDVGVLMREAAVKLEKDRSGVRSGKSVPKQAAQKNNLASRMGLKPTREPAKPPKTEPGIKTAFDVNNVTVPRPLKPLEAAQTNNSKKNKRKPKKKPAKAGNSMQPATSNPAPWHPMKAIYTTPHSWGAVPRNGPGFYFQQDRLVLSTNSDASGKFLLLSNMALGVNRNNLRKILEDVSGLSVREVKVKDLPSGFATASVWLNNPSTEDFENLRSLLQGATVDGRVIQASVTMPSMAKFAY